MDAGVRLRFAGCTMIGATLGQMGLKSSMLDPGGRVAMAEGTFNRIRKVVPLPVDNETPIPHVEALAHLAGRRAAGQNT